MDLSVNINGDASGAQQAFADAGGAAEKSSERQRLAIKQAQDDDVRRWETAAAAAKKAADDIAANEKKKAESIVAANKKITDATHEQLVQQQKDYLETVEAEKAASSEAWATIAKGVAVAGAAVVAFGVDSVKAYAESEKIQLQLVRAAGKYAGALDEQAKALSKLYAVDDDLIKQSQTLLVQWGGVGAATEDVEKAALNLAAAFGGDLNSATSDLIRNVESGGTGLAKMGIHFTATGDKGKDLAAAVAAINAKLGGAAAADANSLTGQLHAAGIAFDDIKKSIGGSISAFITQHDIVGKLTEALRGMQTALGTGDVAEQNAKNEAYGQLQDHLLANIEQRANLMKGIAEMEARGEASPKSRAMVAHLDENIAKLHEIIRLENERIAAGDAPVPGVTGRTNKAIKDAAGGDALSDPAESWKKSFQEETLQQVDLMAERSAKLQAEEEKAAAEYTALMKQQAAEQEKVRKDSLDAQDKMAADSFKAQRAIEDKLLAETQRAEEERAKEASDRAAKQASQWSSAGEQIGAAFVGALSQQLEKMSQGGEFDVAIFVGEIIASAVAVAGTVIGSAYGQPALGAALGNLAAMGVRAGAGAISAGNKKKTRTMHSGGWVGDEAELPRHHSGAWIGNDERAAILQTGERVLARNEVHHMGGPAAVDRMARGGPSITNYIQAIDSKNAAESFMADLGQGMKRALRSGHGDVPRLLGGPR